MADPLRLSAPRRLHPTIRDVAAAAGCSIATVSKALNGGGQLRAETRERVRAAARALGFRPNAQAQSLHRRRTLTIGLVTSDSYGRFSLPILEGVTAALADAEVAVLLANAADDPARERSLVETLLGKRVDGIVVTARRVDPRPPLLLPPEAPPVVYAFARPRDGSAPSFRPDEGGGAALAVRHLVTAGRRRIGHVTGPDDFVAVVEREAGYRTALSAAGIEARPGLVLRGPWSELWGHEAVRRLADAGALRGRDAIDALFCGSDQIARGVVDGLRERGLRVPDDVAVVGFDNWEVIAAATRPPLTTIDMQLEDIGRLAARRLLAMADGTEASGSADEQRLPCRLVRRASCGAGDDTEEGQPPGREE